jgi:protein involved in polysaccharide export with SLBB domain
MANVKPHRSPGAPRRPALIRSFAALVWIAVLLQAGSAQQKPAKQTDDLESLLQDKIAAPAAPSTAIALESVIDAEQYSVGPSDVIQVNIWMSPPFSFSLTVSPEGTLIIPSVAEVHVARMTLARAKAVIAEAVRKRYLVADITATLIKPRQIVVSVTGNVLNPGLYTMSAADRADRAIDEANKLSKVQAPEDLLQIKKFMSTRNVLVQHQDGSSSRVDIQKYYATQDGKWDGYLREGDVIIVPKRDPMRNVIAVYGEVNVPGRIEYVEGDSLLDAFRIAHGATSRAMTEKALFSRLSADGRTMTTRTVSIPALLAGTEPNVPLEPGDRLVLQSRVDQREDFNVDVKGEVKYPGTYPITQGQTRLSEVIRQAGGFTENASLNSSVIIRRSLEKEEMPEEELISLRGVVSTQDTLGYSLETTLRIRREAVTVDFAKLFAQGDSTQDIVLQGEDQVTIAKRQSTVYVFGQVGTPGHITFADHQKADYYIRKAGDFSHRASRGDVKVIKSTTKQWLDPSDATIEPGDAVWVPAEPDHSFSYYMTVASQAASVLSVVIGVAVLIVQVSK